MGFFKKRKKRKEIEEFFDGYLPEENEISQKREAEHQALSCCEQLIATSRELEETKKEYRLVTDYLNDIQIIEGLSPEESERLKDCARNIINLNKVRKEYTDKKRQLSDAQFAQLEQLEEEIPDAIRRLQTNESFQSMVKRDIDNLEGEKSEWSYYLEAVGREQKLLRIGIWIILAVFLVGVVILEYIQYQQSKDMTLFLLLFLLLAAVGGGACILRMQNNRRERKHAQNSINRAITLSNQMKAKYVNVTNAVDYVCEKFHVRNSMELNYLWEQYMEAVKEQEAVEKTSEELDYYTRKLVHDLKQYYLYDATIWLHQVNAILEKKEMVEVKHCLLVRRQKLRKRIEQQVNDIQTIKKQMLLLLKDKQEYYKEIVDVLQSIDQMCGL